MADTNLALTALRNISPDMTADEKIDRLIDALIAHDDDGDIHAEITDPETRIAELESTVTNMEAEISTLTNDLEALEATVSTLQDEMNDALPET